MPTARSRHRNGPKVVLIWPVGSGQALGAAPLLGATTDKNDSVPIYKTKNTRRYWDRFGAGGAIQFRSFGSLMAVHRCVRSQTILTDLHARAPEGEIYV